jgi:FAD synthase
MRATQYGRLTGPVITVVGVWDPFLASHRTLLQQLRSRAAARSRSSLAVLIDPPPGAISRFRLRYGTSGWPVYDSVSTRVGFILDAGVDAVLCMRFRRRDFGATAAEFLDAVRARAEVEELWLGAVQQLGPGPPGSRAAVADYAVRHGLRLTMLPAPPLATYDVRHLLASGRLAEAVRVVGHPPIWARPKSAGLRLAWHPGPYRAIPLKQPGPVSAGSPLDGASTLQVVIRPQSKGPGKLTWPGPEIRYLAFVSGPCDQAAEPDDT